MNTAANEETGMLAGQRALVTGANSGIGEQVAKGLAAAGASVMVNYVSKEKDAHHIRVNSIAPGAVKTPINKSAWQTPEAQQKLLQLIPYDRIGSTADIAKAAVWLASDQSDYITGTRLFVDGGMMLYPGFRTGG